MQEGSYYSLFITSIQASASLQVPSGKVYKIIVKIKTFEKKAETYSQLAGKAEMDDLMKIYGDFKNPYSGDNHIQGNKNFVVCIFIKACGQGMGIQESTFTSNLMYMYK